MCVHVCHVYTHILIAGTEFPLGMALCFMKDLIIYLWLERLALRDRIFRDKKRKRQPNSSLVEILNILDIEKE